MLIIQTKETRARLITSYARSPYAIFLLRHIDRHSLLDPVKRLF